MSRNSARIRRKSRNRWRTRRSKTRCCSIWQRISSHSYWKVKKPLKRQINNLEHIVRNNINTNKVNADIENWLRFDGSNSLANNNVNDSQPIVTIRIIGGKNYIQNLKSGIKYLCYSGATDIMINIKYINPYRSKLRANKAEYITTSS